MTLADVLVVDDLPVPLHVSVVGVQASAADCSGLDPLLEACGYPGIDDIQDEVDYYRTEFTLQSGGTGSFENQEQVVIYDVSGIETPDLNVPNPVDPFRLYNDAGYLDDVNTITGTVMKWDISTFLLL